MLARLTVLHKTATTALNIGMVAARYPLTGCKGSHGLLIDSENRLAFAACEENSKLVVFDMQSKKATATLSVGADPDVLAFDSGLHRLTLELNDLRELNFRMV